MSRAAHDVTVRFVFVVITKMFRVTCWSQGAVRSPLPSTLIQDSPRAIFQQVSLPRLRQWADLPGREGMTQIVRGDLSACDAPSMSWLLNKATLLPLTLPKISSCNVPTSVTVAAVSVVFFWGLLPCERTEGLCLSTRTHREYGLRPWTSSSLSS